MEKNAKIYIAGHCGLVGSAIWNNLSSKGYTNLVGRTHNELDLCDSVAVAHFLKWKSRVRFFGSSFCWRNCS